MYERVDTSSTVGIEQDPVVMVGLILACVAFVGAGVAMVSTPDHSFLALVALWAGIFMFGAGALVLIIQLFRLRGGVLIVSPEGVLDRRIRRHRLLAWSEVRSVGEWGRGGQRMMILGLGAEAKQRVERSRPDARFFLKANAAIGADGLAISATGLKASFFDIRNLITAFAKAHANLDPIPSSRLARSS